MDGSILQTNAAMANTIQSIQYNRVLKRDKSGKKNFVIFTEICMHRRRWMKRHRCQCLYSIYPVLILHGYWCFWTNREFQSTIDRRDAVAPMARPLPFAQILFRFDQCRVQIANAAVVCLRQPLHRFDHLSCTSCKAPVTIRWHKRITINSLHKSCSMFRIRFYPIVWPLQRRLHDTPKWNYTDLFNNQLMKRVQAHQRSLQQFSETDKMILSHTLYGIKTMPKSSCDPKMVLHVYTRFVYSLFFSCQILRNGLNEAKFTFSIS